MTSYTGLPIHPMHVFVLLLAGAFYLSPRNHDGSTKYCHHSAKGQLNPEDLTCRHKLLHYFISQINIISICTYVQCTYIACIYVLCLLLLTNGFISFIFVECCTNVPAKLHSFSSVHFNSIHSNRIRMLYNVHMLMVPPVSSNNSSEIHKKSTCRRSTLSSLAGYWLQCEPFTSCDMRYTTITTGE